MFYIKTGWSKYGIGVMILQADVSEEAINLEAQEKYGRKCEFDKSLELMRLRPISFILRSTVSPLENSKHIFLVEAAAVRWDIGNFRKYFWGSGLTVMSYCSGLEKIFESETNVTHVVHRWRAKLLQ